MGADGESARRLLLPLLGGGIRERPPPDRANADLAANGLAQRQPEESAIRTLTKQQGHVILLITIAVAAFAALAPSLFFPLAGMASFIAFVTALAFRSVIYVRGASAVREQRKSKEDTDISEGQIWPVYTLRIALKDEASSAAQLADAIRGLDYPKDRLDVKLLIEEGDEATRLALMEQNWPQGTGLLIVPPGDPKTKPRALNYGLLGAKGEFVVVYDAEDRPHKGQLKAAVRAFRAGGENLACVQAPLVGDRDRGWIAGQWALEYAVQFGRLLPGLASLGLPISLG